MDRQTTQIMFKRFLWTCPSCGKEDVTIGKVSGGNIYEHNCSECNTWFNNFKEYNGCINYPIDVYEKLDEEQILEDQEIRFQQWLVEIKNPPVYIEPSKEDLQNLYNQKLQELQESLRQLGSNLSIEEVEQIKLDTVQKTEEITQQIITEKESENIDG